MIEIGSVGEDRDALDRANSYSELPNAVDLIQRNATHCNVARRPPCRLPGSD